MGLGVDHMRNYRAVATSVREGLMTVNRELTFCSGRVSMYFQFQPLSPHSLLIVRHRVVLGTVS